MGITGSISLARMHMESCDKDRGSKPLTALENAEKACERARNLTHQLLTFARGGAPVKKPLAVRELLTSAVNFSLSGSNVRCEFEIPEDVWNIEADENQFTQVISNIVLNGVEAMPDGGVLKVRARNRQLEEQEIPKLPAGKVVEITIQDHGIGIPEEHLHRVFDPYFTAKKGGRGLGLAIVYSVVLKHGGHVKLDSEIGMGTSVTIFLPATEASSSRCGQARGRGRGRRRFHPGDGRRGDRAGPPPPPCSSILGYTVETAQDGARDAGALPGGLGTPRHPSISSSWT